MGALLEAVHSASMDEVHADAPALDPPPPQELAHSLVRPLQVLLRFRGDAPLRSLMVDVIEYAASGRQLVVALPPDPPVLPRQQGEIHLLRGQGDRQSPPWFTVKSVEPGTMVQLAVLEISTRR